MRALFSYVSQGAFRTLDLDLTQPCRIGRDEGSTIHILDPGVSRNHAMVQPVDGGYMLYDLNSRNGTHLNGRRVTSPQLLKNGDRIEVGAQAILVTVDAFPLTEKSQLRETDVNATINDMQVTKITVLVADIRGFTTLATMLDAAELARMVSTFFQNAGKELDQLGVSSQKYIGDAVMAVWAHQADSDVSFVLRAMIAASRLHRIASGFQRRLNLPIPVTLGFGINTGMAWLGNFGSGVQADHTAMGDTVNRAFRLEAATREIGDDIVLGEDSFALLGSIPTFVRVFHERSIALKGYAQPVAVRSAKIHELPPGLGTLKLSTSA